jgi:hypothetical protein
MVSGWAWRVPVYWPGGVRCVGGASPVCGFCMERGKADADTGASVSSMRDERWGVERKSGERRKPGVVEYRCGICWRTGS